MAITASAASDAAPARAQPAASTSWSSARNIPMPNTRSRAANERVTARSAGLSASRPKSIVAAWRGAANATTPTATRPAANTRTTCR